jgi:LCP family protein required for cell wall assembly
MNFPNNNEDNFPNHKRPKHAAPPQKQGTNRPNPEEVPEAVTAYRAAHAKRQVNTPVQQQGNFQKAATQQMQHGNGRYNAGTSQGADYPRAAGNQAVPPNYAPQITPPNQSVNAIQNQLTKPKRSKGKKILIGVLVAVLVLVGAGTAFGAWYYNDLKNGLAYNDEDNALGAVLTEATYEEPFYVLVIGSDSWAGQEAHSDAMVLTRVDLNQGLATMVSIPRDTPFNLNGETVKLNQVFTQQGEAACVEAVSQLTGVPISHYVELEFDQLAGVVDSLGGITVKVPYTIDYTVYTNDQATVHIDAGEQVLNGEEAIALARMRTAYSSDNPNITQDAIRQANIRAMMIATIKKIVESPANEIPGHIQSLSGMVKTDAPLEDLIDWAMKFAAADDVKIYSCTGPTAGDVDAATGLWLTEEAPEAWEALMEVVDSGQDPSKVLKSSSDGSVKLETSEVISTTG